MDNNKNPLNLSPEVQDFLNSLVGRAINFGNRVITGIFSGPYRSTAKGGKVWIDDDKGIRVFDPSGNVIFQVSSKNGYAVINVALLTPTLFGSLPASPSTGMMAFVTDSTVNAYGATVAGSGGNKVLAVYDGTNWLVH